MSKQRIRQIYKKITIPLATGAILTRNDDVGVIRGTHTCGKASGATDEFNIGQANENVDQTAGDTDVQVVLPAPIALEFDGKSDTTIAIATDFLKKAYVHPDGYYTLTDSSGGVNYAFAGIVWVVDAKDGVGVKPVSTEVADLLS